MNKYLSIILWSINPYHAMLFGNAMLFRILCYSVSYLCYNLKCQPRF
jgi:hypothetical protein